MGVTVKKAVLWRREVSNKPGLLAETLAPLAKAGANVKVLMGYAYPGDHTRSAIEVYPVTGTKASVAAKEADLKPSGNIACLHVEGRDQAGLGHRIASELGDAGVNITFVMVQVIGDKYSGFFGFDSEADAEKAKKVIEASGKAGSSKKSAKAKAGKTSKKVSKAKKAAAKTTKPKKTSKKGAGGRSKPAAAGKAAQKKSAK